MTSEQWCAALLTWARGQRWWPVGQACAAELVGEIVLAQTPDSKSTIVLLKIVGSGHIVQIPVLAVRRNAESGELTKPAEEMSHDPVEHSAPIGFADGLMLFDGTGEPSFWRAWARSATVVPANGQSEPQARSQLEQAASVVRPMGVEQSNTSVLLVGTDHPLIAKVFRVLQCGVHPEVQLPSALGDWRGVPRLNAYSYLEHRELAGLSCCAVVADAVVGAQDGFVIMQAMAKRGDDPAPVAAHIGALIADMHNRLEAAFASSAGPSNQELRERLDTSLQDAIAIEGTLSTQDVAQIKTAIHLLTGAAGAVTGGAHTAVEAERPKAIRVHGDLHLGQLLLGSDGLWNVVDFEGEPLRPIAERSKPDSPARDIAGMLRSFDYAAQSSGVFDANWLKAARSAFMSGYYGARAVSEADVRMITAYELEKALYELQYEAKFRPSWIGIPLSGIRRLVRR